MNEPSVSSDWLIWFQVISSIGLPLADLYRARKEIKTAAVFWREFLVYFVLVGLGIAASALALTKPRPTGEAIAGTIWLIAWILYLTLRLTRQIRAGTGIQPSRIDRPGLIDLALWVSIIAGAAYYFGCSLFVFCS